MNIFLERKFFWLFFSLVLALVLTLGILPLSKKALFLAQIVSGEPPKISEIKVLEVGTSSAIITWKTDKKTTSLVNFGLSKNYGIARSVISTTSPVIVLDDLEPGTTYYFQAVSIDEQGNQGLAGGYSFTTKGEKSLIGAGEEAGKITAAGEKEIAEEIMRLLEKIKDPKLLAQIAERIEELAKELMKPPAIIGDPIVKVGSDWAEITWYTDREANSMVALAEEADFNPQRENPYIWNVGEPEEMVLEHIVRVESLKPATVYHFQVSSKGIIGPAGKSEDRTFTTKAILPEIRTMRLEKIEEHSATIGITANIPVSVVVEFTNLRTRQTRSAGNPNFSTSHSVRLVELDFGAPYSAVAKIENEIGDRFTSQPLNFTTVKDESPPVISKVSSESTLYPGAETKIQTIVSWETDEPAICQFFYQEGLAPGATENNFPEELNWTIKHVQVITTFVPSTVYKFRINCRDVAGNEAYSEDFVLYTPEKEKSIIDIIIENFEAAFGWIKNIRKK